MTHVPHLRTPPPSAQLYRPSANAVTARDRDLFERHLRSFVPLGAYDAHAHWYTLSASGLLRPEQIPTTTQEDEIGAALYRECTAAWMGDRCPDAGLFFGLPSSARVDTA